MLDHGILNESIAKGKCIMSFRLGKNIMVQETDTFLQPKPPWFGASPDGIVIDPSSSPAMGIIEMKCLYARV